MAFIYIRHTKSLSESKPNLENQKLKSISINFRAV